MPGLDGTGPMGMGPMTGGGRGLCNPYWGGMGYYPAYAPSYGMYPYRPFGFGRGFFGRGRGFGRGFGRGRGWGRGYWGGGYYAPYGMPGYSPSGAPLSREEELDFLKNEADVLRQEMETITNRINMLEKQE